MSFSSYTVFPYGELGDLDLDHEELDDAIMSDQVGIGFCVGGRMDLIGLFSSNFSLFSRPY